MLLTLLVQDTLLAMTQGIDECDIILVFLTRDYINKCNKRDNDHCKLEFQYVRGSRIDSNSSK